MKQTYEVNMDIWQGRIDNKEEGNTKRLFNIIKPVNELKNSDKKQLNKILLGFNCDIGVKRNLGRIGAKNGPDILRKSLANLPAHDINNLFDAGNINCLDNNLEETQNILSYKVEELLNKRNNLPIILGGGHEIAWGTWQGLKKHLSTIKENKEKLKILIINLDAHFDLRTNKEASSGTPFYQISQDCKKNNLDFNYVCLGVNKLGNTKSLFEIAKKLNVNYLEDRQMQTANKSIELLDKLIKQNNYIYLSIDVDVLANMPAASAPASYGVNLNIIEEIILFVKDSNKLKIIDFAEFNPNYDLDNKGAKMITRLIYRFLE